MPLEVDSGFQKKRSRNKIFLWRFVKNFIPAKYALLLLMGKNIDSVPWRAVAKDQLFHTYKI